MIASTGDSAFIAQYSQAGQTDQCLTFSQIKTASQILDYATLILYYPFLSSTPLLDSGPNYINGSWDSGALSIHFGVVNGAVNFPVNGSYFRVTGLVFLGTSNRSFSLSLWFMTISLDNGGTIVHLSSAINDGLWCIRFFGLTSNGSIEIQINTSSGNLVLTGLVMSMGVWTHVVYTCSSANGMRLYITGLLFRSLLFIICLYK